MVHVHSNVSINEATRGASEFTVSFAFFFPTTNGISAFLEIPCTEILDTPIRFDISEKIHHETTLPNTITIYLLES